MFLRMIYDDKLAQAAYLIGCPKSGEAIVIDPERDVDRYERLAAAHGLRITAVAETHIHADFLSGARELAEHGATAYVSGEGGPEWKYEWLDHKKGGGAYDYRLLKDGTTFRVGNIELKAIHTPGHTPEHMCFEVTDRGSEADAPMGVATGDFVFVGDLGRPDLLESAAGQAGQAASSARRLYETVRHFLNWSDYLQVWPAHGSGSACGKALSAVPQSTVGYEKRFNPSVRAAASEDRFVHYILEGQPEPPLYFARMKRENKAGPRVLGGLPTPREITVEEIKALEATTAAVVDTRSWALFRSGHVPGSLSLPLNNSFPTDGGSLIDETEAIYLIVEPSRLDEAVRDLIRVGLDRIAGWFDSRNMAEYAKAGGKLAATPEVSVSQARTLLAEGDRFILDVRRGSEFSEGNIPGAANIPHTRLRSRLQEVPRDRPILVHCRSGARSARAAAYLQRYGYDVTNLAGGMVAWQEANGPIAVGEAKP